MEIERLCLDSGGKVSRTRISKSIVSCIQIFLLFSLFGLAYPQIKVCSNLRLCVYPTTKYLKKLKTNTSIIGHETLSIACGNENQTLIMFYP